MKHRIIYFLLPWEIDDFQRQVEVYLASVQYFKKEDLNNIVFDIHFDISDDNLIDWKKSKLPKKYFKNKFLHYVNILNKYFNVEYSFNSNIRGCGDVRRLAYNKDFDIITWVDSDISFPIILLPTLYYTSKKLYIEESNDFILTPEIIKYWDKSWDPIVNKKYLDKPYNFKRFFNTYNLLSNDKEELNIKHIKGVKFFGGMFPTFTENFYKHNTIPIELGSYGGQDTYLMFIAMLKKISQYKIEGLVVAEFGRSMWKKYIKDNIYIREGLKKREHSIDELYNLAKRNINMDNNE